VSSILFPSAWRSASRFSLVFVLQLHQVELRLLSLLFLVRGDFRQLELQLGCGSWISLKALPRLLWILRPGDLGDHLLTAPAIAPALSPIRNLAISGNSDMAIPISGFTVRSPGPISP
jgi:hypothetical protein